MDLFCTRKTVKNETMSEVVSGEGGKKERERENCPKPRDTYTQCNTEQRQGQNTDGIKKTDTGQDMRYQTGMTLKDVTRESKLFQK